jgi:hypothetical protein
MAPRTGVVLSESVGHQIAGRDGDGLFRAAFNQLIPDAAGDQFPITGTNEF